MSLWTRRCSLDCNKKVNHEMPTERFPSSLAPRYRAHFVSAQIGLACASRPGAKWRQNRRRQKRKTTTLSIAYTLAEDAVRCELVSTPNSLLTGKLTGNFAESGPPPRFFESDQRTHSIVYSRIPCATEQGISKRVSGKIFQGTGNRHADTLISGAPATVPSNMPVASVDVCLWGAVRT
jgi:hypothetical protein